MKKYKNNYSAWGVDANEFDSCDSLSERIRFLLRYAVLAPSSLNGQPWQFKICEDTLFAFTNPLRSLPASDYNSRQMFIGLGCAIQNIKVASDYYGYHADTVYLPNQTEDQLIARLRFEPTPVSGQSNNHLIHSIRNRCTNRSPYTERPLGNEFVCMLKNLSDDDTHVSVIYNNKTKHQLASITGKATETAFSNSAFRKELGRYVLPSTSRASVGMPGNGLGMPFVVSLLAPLLLSFANISKKQRRAVEQLLSVHTPAVCIISTRNDSKKEWLKTGELFEHIALTATRENISIHPLTASIQINNYYTQIQKVINTRFRPQMFFRIGYSTTPAPHSPRLQAPDVLIH